MVSIYKFFFSEIRGTKQFSKEFLQKIVLFFKNIKFPLWLFWQEISSSLVICRTFQIFFIFYLKLVAHKQASLTLYNPVLFLVSGNVTRCRLPPLISKLITFINIKVCMRSYGNIEYYILRRIHLTFCWLDWFMGLKIWNYWNDFMLEFGLKWKISCFIGNVMTAKILWVTWVKYCLNTTTQAKLLFAGINI